MKPLRLPLYYRTLDQHKFYNEKAEDHLRQRPALWDDIVRYRETAKTTGCSDCNLWELYRTIRWLRPAEVLECGSGLSTVAIAHALLKNVAEKYDGRLTSMEDQPEYFEEHQRLCPDALKPLVDYVLSPKRDASVYCFSGVAYTEIPNRPYEFVFVDGPYHGSSATGQMTCDLDFLEVVSRSSTPVWGQIDGRITTAYAYQSLLPRSQVRFDPKRGITFLGPLTKEDLPILDSGTLFYLAMSRRDDPKRYVPVSLR